MPMAPTPSSPWRRYFPAMTTPSASAASPFDVSETGSPMSVARASRSEMSAPESSLPHQGLSCPTAAHEPRARATRLRAAAIAVRRHGRIVLAALAATAITRGTCEEPHDRCFEVVDVEGLAQPLSDAHRTGVGGEVRSGRDDDDGNVDAA